MVIRKQLECLIPRFFGEGRDLTVKPNRRGGDRKERREEEGGGRVEEGGGGGEGGEG